MKQKNIAAVVAVVLLPPFHQQVFSASASAQDCSRGWDSSQQHVCWNHQFYLLLCELSDCGDWQPRDRNLYSLSMGFTGTCNLEVHKLFIHSAADW